MCVSITRCFYSKSGSSFYCRVSPPTAVALERCDLPISRTLQGCLLPLSWLPHHFFTLPSHLFQMYIFCTQPSRAQHLLVLDHFPPFFSLTLPVHPSPPRLLFCAAVPRSTCIRSAPPWPTTLLPCNMDEPNTINTKSVDRECYV